MSFQIIRNDITKVKADVIVNSANSDPTYGSGTDAAIYHAAGEKELLEARKVIGPIAPGQSRYTPAFHLQAKYIIHTVGPYWTGGDHGVYIVKKKSSKSERFFPIFGKGIPCFQKDYVVSSGWAAVCRMSACCIR